MVRRVTKDPDVRRDEMMDAALQLAIDAGWDTFSIDQLTAAVGVAKGTFYYHFASKTDLLGAICLRWGDAVFTRVNEALPTLPGTAADRLKAIIALATDWKLAHVDDALASVALLYSPANAELRHRLYETWFHQCRPLFAPLIAQGVADGSFDVTDPEATTEVFLSVWVDVSTRIFDRALAADTTDDFVDIIMRGQRALATAADRILGVAPGTFAIPVTGDDLRALHAPFLAAIKGTQR